MAQTVIPAPAETQVPSAAIGPAPAAEVARPNNGYRFRDAAGNVAYLWWEPSGPVVECEDAALRRRVRRALKRPIWIVEDELDEDGVQWSTRKHVGPEDPRYAAHWFWSLGQVGLGDTDVEIVRRADRRVVWTPATGHIQD
jgi:hypothetical protein